MEKLEAQLAAWRAAPVRAIPVASLDTDEALQPRLVSLASLREQRRLEANSEEHIERIAADLVAFPTKDYEPLLVADFGSSGLFVVDGHHRLEAYRLAGRTVVPARVMRAGRLEAAMVAKLANCDGAKLPLHRSQCAEAVWQYLAQLTRRGTVPLPPGLSTRKMAARFGGVSHSTVSRMLGHIPTVDLELFAAPSLDPATGWPRWKYVRGNAFLDYLAQIPPEVRIERQAEKMAGRIAALFDDAGPEVSARAIELLLADRAGEEPIERLCDWAIAHEDY